MQIDTADGHLMTPYVLCLHQSVSLECEVLLSIQFTNEMWEVNSPTVHIIMFKRMARGRPIESGWMTLMDWCGMKLHQSCLKLALLGGRLCCMCWTPAGNSRRTNRWMTVAYTAQFTQTVNVLYNVSVSEIFSAYCCWCSTSNCVASYSQTVGTEGE